MKKPAGGPPATAKTVAKPAHHAHMTKAQHQRAQAAAAKAAATRKHRAAAAAKHHHKGSAKHSKKRGLANVEGGLACCAAEALAMSLRLAGWPVSDAEVVNLYRLTAAGPDGGASIEDTLNAAARVGLAGFRVAGFGVLTRDREFAVDVRAAAAPHAALSAAVAAPALAALGHAASLVLGVELPGSHAVLATADGWWSWGEPFNPAAWPGLVVEEAWAVSWQ